MFGGIFRFPASQPEAISPSQPALCHPNPNGGNRPAMAVAFGRKKKDAPGAAKAKAKAPASHFEPPASPEAVSASPKQSATTGRPKVFLEIAIFRGAFFGVDHQQSLEFELFPEVAPKAVRRLLEDCAALRLRDRRLQVTQSLATLEGGDLGEPQAETGCGMKHTEPGMLSVARGADFAGYLLTLAPLPRLDREHRAFGRLVQGEAFLQHIRDAHNSECKVLRGLNPSRSRSASSCHPHLGLPEPPRAFAARRPWPPMAAPSAAAAAGAAAAALLQRQLPGGEGWSEHQTGDGRKFFHNEDTGVSQWEKPESLMSEGEKLVNSTAWKQYRIWDGRIFYHNKETKVSCWSMPPDLRKLRGESTGLDDRPLPDTSTERRNAFQEFLEERIDASWDWRRVQQVAQSAPQASGVSEQVQRQVFAELLSMALRKSEAQARAKARNAAVALERLIEERFSDPDALGTSYEEAARILGDEEAWTLIKSEVRRDEVFQNAGGPGGNVQQALDLYSASRIGHGYRCLDTEAYEAAKAKGTHFELCPSSSVSTQAVQLKHWSEHPIRRFFQDRTSCSINSDDPAIFQCSLTDELALCLEMGLTLQDLRWMTLEALKHSFNLEAHLKESLAETVTAFYEPPPKRRRVSRLSEEMPVKQELPLTVKMEKQEDEDDTNALDALIAAASAPVKVEPVKTERTKAELEPVKTEPPPVKAEDDDDDTEEEEDPLMGAALKAAAVKEELE
ncbi:unnamed protein product [Effrenium voratum]|nr:unnamed protein product [Effrenium voratum]